jgi:preprotein translocase subunit SecA
MNNAKPIMASIIKLLIETGWQNGLNDQSLQEIEEFCNELNDCLQLVDGFFSILGTRRQQQHINKEDILQKGRDFRNKAMHALHQIGSNVTTKAHVIEDHCTQMMDVFEMIGNLDEQWVEHLHQVGVRDAVHTRSMRDRMQKYTSPAWWRQVSLNPKVKAVQIEKESGS